MWFLQNICYNIYFKIHVITYISKYMLSHICLPYKNYIWWEGNQGTSTWLCLQNFYGVGPYPFPQFQYCFAHKFCCDDVRKESDLVSFDILTFAEMTPQEIKVSVCAVQLMNCQSVLSLTNVRIRSLYQSSNTWMRIRSFYINHHACLSYHNPGHKVLPNSP